MGMKTVIEYCDSTVNPIMGCSGCELYSPDHTNNHCYAAALINRYAGRKGWPKRFDLPEHFPHRIPQALRWPDLTNTAREGKPWLNGRPRVIFINDLSDGFCPSVSPETWLTPRLEAIAESPHIWLLLTKWPKKMRLFCELHPLPENVWPGVTVMRQKDEWRIGPLLRISAARHWLSVEPLLGSVHIWPFELEPAFVCSECGWKLVARLGDENAPRLHRCGPRYVLIRSGLNWLIVGGESGPGARPMHPQWARDIRDQCQAAGVPFFFKQQGEWTPGATHDYSFGPAEIGERCIEHDGKWTRMYRVGRKQAGHLLDGQEWREFPRTTAGHSVEVL